MLITAITGENVEENSVGYRLNTMYVYIFSKRSSKHEKRLVPIKQRLTRTFQGFNDSLSKIFFTRIYVMLGVVKRNTFFFQ